jgi:hypothetical protein
VNRFRPGYRVAFDAWVATHPLKNPNARPDGTAGVLLAVSLAELATLPGPPA